MKRVIANFLSDERGATAIEYTIIAGLLSIAIVGAVDAIGTDVGTLLATVTTAFN